MPPSRPAPRLAAGIGLVAQSGGIVLGALEVWCRLGLGVSGAVSIGDAQDVGPRDLLAWFDEDPGTDVVVLYVESEPDLRGLVRTAGHLAERVPVLALEPGTSVAGGRAVPSHTARAATPWVVRRAVYTAAGIQPVPDMVSLHAAVGLLSGQPLPRGPRVAVLTSVGGGGVLAADACGAAGLDVAALPDEVRRRLVDVLPPLASVQNPVDAGAVVSAESFAAALTVLMDSPAVDAVITVTAPTAVSDPAPGVVQAVADSVDRGVEVPVIDVRLGSAEAVRRIELPGDPDGTSCCRSVNRSSPPPPSPWRADTAHGWPADEGGLWCPRVSTCTPPPPS